MARLVERVLMWIAGLVAIAALLAAVISFLPDAFRALRLPGLVPKQGRPTTVTIDLAERAVARGDARTALDFASRAVTENPGDAAIANRAGNVALRVAAPHQAERYYLIGEGDDGHYPWNFIALGQLYEREGKKELADEQLRAGSIAAPGLPFVHYDLGVVEMEEGLYAAALADFETELRRSPSYRPAVIGRAEALEKVGRASEAVALYRRAGINPRQPNARPKLSVTPLVTSATSRTALTRRTKRPTRATETAIATSLSPSERTGITATAGQARPPWATPQPSPQPSGVVAKAPTASAKPLSEVSGDARSYLLDVAQDLGFTRTLPSADASQTTAALRFALMDALAHKPVDVDSLLRIGTAALLSGRVTLAAAAFNAASDAAPQDWRGPYFAGLTKQANGETQEARSLFGTALAREPRAEIYTSLALVDLQEGDLVSAGVNARRAADVNPSYEPGRFVAGMIDLVESDVRSAERNLSAANTLGGAPARTAYFLTQVHDIIGASTDQRS